MNDNNLEPRLSEYLKKKKYNKEHNIKNPHIEKDYMIDSKDIETINYFIRYNKPPSNKNNFSDFVDPSGAQFPSSQFKPDERLKRIQKKQESHQKARESINNYDNISKKYDMYRNDRKFASMYGDDFTSNFNPSEWITSQNSRDSDFKNNYLLDNNSNQNSLSNSNTYKNPKSTYTGYIRPQSNIYNDPNSTDAIIGNIDTYRSNLNSIKRESENSYFVSPTSNSSQKKNFDADNFVHYGSTPSRSSKSLGYPNPSEHYFNYISDDIQNPDNVVNPRGMNSRSLNKTLARHNTHVRENYPVDFI